MSFSKTSVKYLIKNWHPDKTLQNGFVDKIKEKADSLLMTAFEFGDLKTVKSSVKENFPDHVYKNGNKYLRAWSDVEKQMGTDEFRKYVTNEKYSVNGIYFYPLKLSLNPRNVEKKLDARPESKKKMAAYMTYVIEHQIFDIFMCIDKKMSNPKRKVQIKDYQDCV